MTDLEMIDSQYEDICQDNLISTYKMQEFIEQELNKGIISEEDYNRLKEKVLVCHQKMRMMFYSRSEVLKILNNFEVTQNMDFPCLFGLERTKILFYTESLVLLARSALDVSAYLFSYLCLKKRKDSFNDFSKIILSGKEDFCELYNYFLTQSDSDMSIYRLLCGSEKGRALRDIIAHQTNIKLEYFEYKENSEKERLFVIIDKVPYDYRFFLKCFCDEVELMLLNIITIIADENS